MEQRTIDNGHPQSLEASLVQAAPVLLRLAGAAYVRGVQWSVVASVRVGNRVVRAAASGENPADFLTESAAELRDYARRLLGFETIPDAVVEEDDEPTPPPAHQTLRGRGAELLRQSADIDYEEYVHPAFERILDDMAPDEARILRLLCRDGAQAAVDVRESKPLNLGSQMVAPGLSMIGTEAGCRYLDRVPAYLNNLYRLGLIWFSREPLADPRDYQVLEAQPEVVEALDSAGRGKTVRRSIHLTPFGDDFCRMCLPLDMGEIDALTQAAADLPPAP